MPTGYQRSRYQTTAASRPAHETTTQYAMDLESHRQVGMSQALDYPPRSLVLASDASLVVADGHKASSYRATQWRVNLPTTSEAW